MDYRTNPLTRASTIPMLFTNSTGLLGFSGFDDAKSDLMLILYDFTFSVCKLLKDISVHR